MSEKLWGGRFSQPTDKFVEEFTASIQFDQRLYRYDIQGSIAHCKMLAKQGIIAPDEATTIIDPKDADWLVVTSQVAMKSTDGGKSWVPFKGAPGGDDYQAGSPKRG